MVALICQQRRAYSWQIHVSWHVLLQEIKSHICLLQHGKKSQGLVLYFWIGPSKSTPWWLPTNIREYPLSQKLIFAFARITQPQPFVNINIRYLQMAWHKYSRHSLFELLSIFGQIDHILHVFGKPWHTKPIRVQCFLGWFRHAGPPDTKIVGHGDNMEQSGTICDIT